MSKRYREVLEEVETPATRRAAEVAAVETPVDPVAEVDEDTTTATDTTAVGAGRVATLVRPTRTDPARVAVGQRPVTMRPARARPDPSVRPTSTRPGNGPADADEPLAFAWRGRHYEVTRILGHWREEEGWWRRPDGEPIQIEQSDLWRVEATRGTGPAGRADSDARGVYELARRGSTWRLDRVWD